MKKEKRKGEKEEKKTITSSRNRVIRSHIGTR
jgi:hypothetical protein